MTRFNKFLSTTCYNLVSLLLGLLFPRLMLVTSKLALHDHRTADDEWSPVKYNWRTEQTFPLGFLKTNFMFVKCITYIAETIDTASLINSHRPIISK